MVLDMLASSHEQHITQMSDFYCYLGVAWYNKGPGILVSRSPGPLRSTWRGLSLGDVLRLHALPALGRLVGDLAALLKRLEAVADYTAVVDK
jgi:hypothetical protein